MKCYIVEFDCAGIVKGFVNRADAIQFCVERYSEDVKARLESWEDKEFPEYLKAPTILEDIDNLLRHGYIDCFAYITECEIVE